jgi:cyclic pyranopterin phosphate synthase
MRCTYCRPVGYQSAAKDDRLRPNEIASLVEHLACRHGVRKVRLTGGEPTTRPDLIEIVERLASIDALHDLAMTTNGLTLHRDAAALAGAGLTRVNVSLDALDPPCFTRMTGVDGVDQVIAGIAQAQRVGLTPVRLNTVVVRGGNESQLPRLVCFAADHGCEIRFIELMPMGPLAEHWAERYICERDIWRHLDSVVASKQAAAQTSQAARRYAVRLTDGRTVTVGMITAMSTCFCDQCDRMRIGADGTVYPCLMDKPAGNLMPALRPRFDPQQLDQLLMAAFARKPAEHPATGATVMTQMGG